MVGVIENASIRLWSKYLYVLITSRYVSLHQCPSFVSSEMRFHPCNMMDNLINHGRKNCRNSSIQSGPVKPEWDAPSPSNVFPIAILNPIYASFQALWRVTFIEFTLLTSAQAAPVRRPLWQPVTNKSMKSQGLCHHYTPLCKCILYGVHIFAS